jgi:hypothetical protein
MMPFYSLQKALSAGPTSNWYSLLHKVHEAYETTNAAASAAVAFAQFKLDGTDQCEAKALLQGLGLSKEDRADLAAKWTCVRSRVTGSEGKLLEVSQWQWWACQR